MALPVSFRWDEEFIARIDAARGLVPRSAFVRYAIEAQLNSPVSSEQPIKLLSTTEMRARVLDTEDFQNGVEEVSQAGIEAEVSRATGHERGCGCLRCDTARAAI